MRLIDADELMKDRVGNDPVVIAAKCASTAYDMDKVVEQLEQQKSQYFRRAEEIKNGFGENSESEKNYGKAYSYEYAIEIVKSGFIK